MSYSPEDGDVLAQMMREIGNGHSVSPDLYDYFNPPTVEQRLDASRVECGELRRSLADTQAAAFRWFIGAMTMLILFLAMVLVLVMKA